MITAPAKIDSSEEAFSPSDYLLGVLQSALAKARNIQLTLPGGHHLWMSATEQKYFTEVDTEEFWRTPAAQVEVSDCPDELFAADQRNWRPIGEMLWRAAFHASQGRLTDASNKYDVVQFKGWPNLTRVPITPNSARICALLNTHPTTLMLVRTILKIDTTELFSVYSAAHAAGVVDVITIKNGKNAEPEDSDEKASSREAKESQNILSFLFTKILGF